MTLNHGILTNDKNNVAIQSFVNAAASTARRVWNLSPLLQFHNTPAELLPSKLKSKIKKYCINHLPIVFCDGDMLLCAKVRQISKLV